MRDYLCKENDLKRMLDFNSRRLVGEIEDLAQLKDDLANGIQRYPLPTEEVIFNTKKGIITLIRDLIRAKYSLGLPCDELEELYMQRIPYIDDIGYGEYDYINMVQHISLGILLEVSHDKMQILVNKIDEAKVDDILLDYLVCAYGLKREVHSTGYQSEVPYREIIEIAEIAKHDKEKASVKLKEYTEKNYIKGHADCEWPTAHKRAGYYGLWSFEAGAVAKVLQIEDGELIKSNHYPYDLVHYKNQMEFHKDAIDLIHGLSARSEVDLEECAEGIPLNTDLEQIVPGRFQAQVNQVIADYESLSERDFWEKYELNQIWFEFEEFSKENRNGLLGTLIIFILVEKGYILQIDYKEELEDYEEDITNYWNTADTVLIKFELDNDQEYYARVPRNYNLKNVYEIKISTCH